MRRISDLFEVEGFHKLDLSFTLSPNLGGPRFSVSAVGGKVPGRKEKNAFLPLYIWTVVRCDLDDPGQPFHIPKPLCCHHYNGMFLVHSLGQ